MTDKEIVEVKAINAAAGVIATAGEGWKWMTGMNASEEVVVCIYDGT